MKIKKIIYLLTILAVYGGCKPKGEPSIESLKLNEQDYFEKPGLSIMVFNDYYPEGHQGGVSIIQHEVRVATNGDLRLEPTPGQWQPLPKFNNRAVNREKNEISGEFSYPDSSRMTGFNPIVYPDLHFSYTVRVVGEGNSIRVIVDLPKALPDEWIGKVGYNLELYPGILFGKTYNIDDKVGIFTPQANGPVFLDSDSETQISALGQGRKLTVAPECDLQRLSIESLKSDLQLIDGRGKHNNGWFIVRSLIPKGATTGAIEWLITPNTVKDWQYTPVVHVSQVGYHPSQSKVAVIETGKTDNSQHKAILQKINADGSLQTIKESNPKEWGNFLRYRYLQFDFSDVNTSGMYVVKYNNSQTEPFQIDSAVFKRHVWQPVIEYFLPVQMCHMEVRERYRVWHGRCHLDDALMAPTDYNHFDGYAQGASTLTQYKPYQIVPGLNVGGWHDAGDYDLRVESQAGSVMILAHIYEDFKVDYDQTTVNFIQKSVEIHKPDGKPDVLQQIEHGVNTILAGYKSLGRLYRGIIDPTLQQYVHLGDAATMSDNLVYESNLKAGEIKGSRSGNRDDRWVFTEVNPSRELFTAAALASASRVLRTYNDALSAECLKVAVALWETNKTTDNKRAFSSQVEAATELFITTGDAQYQQFILGNGDKVVEEIKQTGWLMARIINQLDNDDFKAKITASIKSLHDSIQVRATNNPFNVPYKPQIWGDGWTIQNFAVEQYYLHKGFPDIFDASLVFNSLNFVLGCHPGSNTASFASGVGSRSMTVAYGVNRADWSYIPGGVVSGTGIIRPDFPELKDFPYLWQQAEYVMGGGSENYMFMVLAADHLLNR